LEKSAGTELENKKLRIWLWISVIAALSGAVMLFPIDGVILNVIFILVKAGMITGLLMQLIGHDSKGFKIWTAFSMLAVVMTVVKWAITGHVVPLFILAIITDVLMPSVAYRLYGRK